MKQLTAKEFFDELMAKHPDFKTWYESEDTSDEVKRMAEKYPFVDWKVKEGCPNLYAVPGTIVHLNTYTESGKLGVVVLSRDKLPMCLENEKQYHNQKMLEKLKNDELPDDDPAKKKLPDVAPIEKLHEANVQEYVDPEFLEPYFDDKDEQTNPANN